MNDDFEKRLNMNQQDTGALAIAEPTSVWFVIVYNLLLQLSDNFTKKIKMHFMKRF